MNDLNDQRRRLAATATGVFQRQRLETFSDSDLSLAAIATATGDSQRQRPETFNDKTATSTEDNTPVHAAKLT